MEEFKDALSKAVHFIMHKDRTKQEVVRRLQKEEYSSETIEKVMEYLEENKYINDRRYAEYYVTCYCDRRSLKRIKMELRNKGISDDIINRYLESCSNEEAITRVLEKQMRRFSVSSLNELTYEQRSRVLQAMVRQGYDLDLVKRNF